MDGYDFEWVKYDKKFVFGKSEQEVINWEDKYIGTYDADGLYDGVECTYDLKSGRLDKNKWFMQLAAYNKPRGIKRMVVIHIGPKAKQTPYVEDDVDKYYAMFMEKRAEFKERFGI